MPERYLIKNKYQDASSIQTRTLGIFMKCLIFTFALTSNVISAVELETMSDKTLYFAFGSNLLTSRMHVFNPTAVRAGIGKVENYHLDFVAYSRIWQAYAASIVPRNETHLWGALWEIPTDDIPELDKQEGVHAKVYYPITVDVITPEGKILKARTYRQVGTSEHVNLENLPKDRKPSPAYMNTIIQGAIESGLPDDYIEYLKKIPHNGSTIQPNLGYVYPKA